MKEPAMDVWRSDDDGELSDPPTDFDSYDQKLSHVPAERENDDSELSDPPTDLDSDDDKLKITKRKGRATNFRSKQENNTTDSGEENKEGVQSDADDTDDEWNPSRGAASSKKRKAPRKPTKKNASKTKKATEPLGCPWPGCDARLARIDHLRRHIATHNKEKPFRCPADFCDFASKRRDNLAEHLKLRHKLSAATARSRAAAVAEAAKDEIRSHARVVEATIKAAAGTGDAESGGDVAAGGKRKNKDRGDVPARGKKRARVVSSRKGAAEAGAGGFSEGAQEEDRTASTSGSKKHGRRLRSAVAKETAADDKETQSKDGLQNTLTNHDEDTMGGSGTDEDGSGVPLLNSTGNDDDDASETEVDSD